MGFNDCDADRLRERARMNQRGYVPLTKPEYNKTTGEPVFEVVRNVHYKFDCPIERQDVEWEIQKMDALNNSIPPQGEGMNSEKVKRVITYAGPMLPLTRDSRYVVTDFKELSGLGREIEESRVSHEYTIDCSLNNFNFMRID